MTSSESSSSCPLVQLGVFMLVVLIVVPEWTRMAGTVAEIVRDEGPVETLGMFLCIITDIVNVLLF